VKLTCEDCGAPVAPDDINIERALAKCQRCGAVFGFADRVGNTRGSGAPRGPVAMPKGIEVFDLGADLTIVRRWFGWKFMFLAVFCLIWNGFLVTWYGLALAAEETPWVMLVFPVLHVAAGVGLTYYTLCGFLNRTELRLGQGRFRLRHGPLPWPGRRDLEASRFEQLYCTEEVRRTKNGTQVTYTLRGNTRDGESLKLLSLDDKDQALFIEQRVESALGIRDRPVAGEVQR
jgi:hypothetical protein